MARRRKYPFYRPVHHRVADSYRRDIADVVKRTINVVVVFGGLFLIAYIFGK